MIRDKAMLEMAMNVSNARNASQGKTNTRTSAADAARVILRLVSPSHIPIQLSVTRSAMNMEIPAIQSSVQSSSL